MALRKHGRTFYAYFIQWERDGSELRKRLVERSLSTDDIDIARALEAKLMQDARQKSKEARSGAKIEAILSGGTVRKIRTPPRRLKIADALDRAARYADVGDTAKKLWRRFERESGFTFMNDVTPRDALNYLEKVAPNGGKYYNNTRSALNGIYRLLLIDAGMESSPFALVRSVKVSSLSQRPITSEEYRRILAVADSPWKEAVQIAWHTGLREKDVFTLKWSEISGDLIRKLPAKTARFRREVLIPIHPALQRVLDALPRKGERVLGAWAYKPNYIYFKRSFGKILAAAGIEQEDASGRVVFNSLRNSFISRCDAAGIPRHAIRGIVGHVSDSMTDLYSHDETSARLIQTLPE
jgi:integrase